ncbi:hypothetical protein OIU89_08875 [Escherichia coli]|nr:hypothetical protein [Escherichia coli]
MMTGNADFSALPEEQRRHTISLKDFLKFADRGRFNNYFKPHPATKVLNKDFHLFDDLFLGPQTAPKALRVNGYEANDMIFEHPKRCIENIWQNLRYQRTAKRYSEYGILEI